MGAKNLYKLTVAPVFPSVPLSRCLGMGRWDKCRFLGTGGRTDTEQLDLKALANKVLHRDNGRDKNETVARKIVSRGTSKNSPLSRSKTLQKSLLQPCISCHFWQAKRCSVWWYGLCGLNGQRISHKGEVFCEHEPDFDRVAVYGEGMNLGAFRDYVHGHDINNVVRIKLDWDNSLLKNSVSKKFCRKLHLCGILQAVV